MKFLLLPFLFISSYCTSTTESDSINQNNCEWCGANEAPKDATWKTTIASPEERGERLHVSGTVLTAEGDPATGVILYLYHTNAEGIYPKKGNEKGNGRRHGYLRGWIKTNQNGEYAFETIKPAAYPGRTEPAHIHLTIKEPNKEEYWLKSFLFAGDELLKAEDLKNNYTDDRFNHVLELTTENGILYGKRDIQLRK
ncbi:intradiol ring-cleavage dioxygenase [Ekhidna sp.]|uniref:dioxygenase family protein n=1 Tax=Ekhidna sp. TaxID=2608089 RepID=UPI003CCB996E